MTGSVRWWRWGGVQVGQQKSNEFPEIEYQTGPETSVEIVELVQVSGYLAESGENHNWLVCFKHFLFSLFTTDFLVDSYWS